MADEPTGTEPAALYERRGSVAIITLNRPRALNAVERRSRPQWAVCSSRPSGRRGAGHRSHRAGRAFCAGADLKALGSGAPLDADGHPEWGFAGYAQHWISKPTIAAVNGFALGGGTELVLASDLAVVDEHAQLGLPEVTRGLFAAAGGVIRMQQQIPRRSPSKSRSPAHRSPRRRQELGLVNRVAPAGTALDVALELAEKIAANAPLVGAGIEGHDPPHRRRTPTGNRAWGRKRQAIAIVFTSADAQGRPDGVRREAPAGLAGPLTREYLLAAGG